MQGFGLYRSVMLGLAHGRLGQCCGKTVAQTVAADTSRSVQTRAGRLSASSRSRSVQDQSETQDWNGASVKLSDRLRERLGQNRNEAASPILVADDSEAIPLPTRLQDGNEAFDAPLDLRDRRPVTGEFVEMPELLQSYKPQYVKVKSADYIKSSLKARDWPKATMPEIAVIGRSNVGKSSLINMLTGRKELALVSKTPGKTRAINHFLINKAWYLVDLPGYGYAKQSKENRFTWGKFTQQFFTDRTTLVQVLLLIDATVPTQELDLGCAQWLYDNGVPFSIVYTKMDKRKKRCLPPTENINLFQDSLKQLMPVEPGTVATSASDGKGKDDLLRYLAAIRACSGFA